MKKLEKRQKELVELEADIPQCKENIELAEEELNEAQCSENALRYLIGEKKKEIKKLKAKSK